MIVTLDGVATTYAPSGTLNGRTRWVHPQVSAASLFWNGVAWEGAILTFAGPPSLFQTAMTASGQVGNPADPSFVSAWVTGSQMPLNMTVAQGPEVISAPPTVTP